jgi:ribonuclease P/MRP protein subunit POP5
MPKLVKPSLRERNRYVVVDIMSERQLERKPVVDAIWGALLRLFGEFGAAKTSLWVMDWEPQKRRGIVKVNHESVDMLRAAAATVKEIDGKKAIISVTRVSGTLRAAREGL